MVAMPPGALAYDDADQFAAPYSPFSVDTLADTLNSGDIIALASVSISSGLRSGLKVLKYENAPITIPDTVQALKGGALMRFTKSRS